MKKIILSMLSLLLSMTLLCACNLNVNLNVNDNNSNTDSNEESEIDTSSYNDEQVELLNILKNININMEVGTAGSSLKAVSYATSLMNFAVKAKITFDEIKTVVNDFKATISDEEFQEKISLLKNTYDMLLSNDRDELLEDSGNIDEDNSWIATLSEKVKSIEKVDEFFQLFD